MAEANGGWQKQMVDGRSKWCVLEQVVGGRGEWWAADVNGRRSERWVPLASGKWWAPEANGGQWQRRPADASAGRQRQMVGGGVKWQVALQGTGGKRWAF